MEVLRWEMSSLLAVLASVRSLSSASERRAVMLLRSYSS